MRTRLFTLLAVLALVVAACGPGEGAETSTTAASDPTTTTAAQAPDAMLLSYSLEAGQTRSYEVDLDQNIVMSVEGDPSALGEGEEIPGDMNMNIAGTTTFTYTVADGPEPGTYAVTITGDLTDLGFSGTIDGEPVDQSEIPDFAGMEPVDVTVVVDEQGNIIPDESGLGEDFLGGLGALGGMDMLGQMGPGAGAGVGQFIGPPFSDEEVTVGDTWSEIVEVPTLPGDEPITTTIDSEVTGSDTIDDREVFVIETTTSTSEIDFDLAELLIGFMTAFVPEDASDEDMAQLDALTQQLRFAFSIDPQTTEMTTWFDHDAGLAVKADFASATHMVMDINIPDEDTGDLVQMGMDMTIDQNINYRLLDAGDGDDA